MNIKRIGTVAALTLMIAIVPARPTSLATGTDVTETQISAAAIGYFASGTSFNGVPIQSATFGIGVIVYSDGSGLGNFEIKLTGTTPLNQEQDITVVGNVSAGTVNLDGSVTFSGNGTLDMGDGTLPVAVPFAVVVTANGLQLTVATTALPTLPVSDGSIFIG
jgi:hypothetical protein